MSHDTVEAILADFRDWLQRLQAPEREEPDNGTEMLAAPDLSTLLGEMIALKQEVHLQTRAVRGQQAQNDEAVRRLGSALDALEEKSDEEEDRELTSILSTLVELYDALSLAEKEAIRVRDAVLPALGELQDGATRESMPAPDVELPPIPNGRRSFWARMLGVRHASAQSISEWRSQVRDNVARALEAQREKERAAQIERVEQVHRLLTALVAGYAMGLQRVERALSRHDLQAMSTVGDAFDPECMEVLEVVADSGRADNEVVEEVRRGYTRHGKTFRTAQVRVAKS